MYNWHNVVYAQNHTVYKLITVVYIFNNFFIIIGRNFTQNLLLTLKFIIMKKIILFSLLIGLVFNLQAQLDFYSVTQANTPSGGYPGLSASATTLWTTGDDEEQTGVPIGFNFYYGGQKYTTCTVGVNGAISFTQNNINYVNDLASTVTDKRNIIAPLWDDLQLYAANNGYVKYETVGTAPNRIFKVSWMNISRHNDSSHDMSFILELKETSNEIEFYYGHCDSGAYLTASVGLNFYDGTDTSFISVTPDGSGNSASSSTSTSNNSVSESNYPRLKHITFSFTHAYNDWDFQARSIALADPRDNSSIVMNYANNVGATNSHGHEPTCAGFNGGDVWYKFTAPTTGAISIIRTAAGGFGDLGYAIYHNAVLTDPVYCNRINSISGYINKPNMVGNLISGDTYYIRMWDFNNNNFGITPFYVAKVEPNDEAAYAININVQPEDASVFLMTTANNTFAMDSEHINDLPSCGGTGVNRNYQGGDIWYKFTAPTNGIVKVKHSDTAGDWSSFSFAIYDSATATSDVACETIYIAGNTAPYEVKTITGLTGGQDYWLRTWDFRNNQIGTSTFYLTDDALGVEDYQQLSFKFYPNPATDVLNVSAASNIDMISITNLLGQEVRHIAPNQKQVALNIADLQNGVYLMKVQTGEKVSTVKFIKK